jgi:(p)ppGpp synthase/HD superfamily hydrolase
LLAIKPDITSIQACFLHDVIEDTPKTEADIVEAFGESVAKICV